MWLLRLLTINFLFLIVVSFNIPSFAGKVNITADSFESKENLLIYKGHVVAVLSQNKTVKCDVLEIHLKNGEVEEIVATGKVLYKDSEYTAVGNKMIYSPLEKKIYLFGNATVSSRKGILKGDKIVYDIKTKSMDVITLKNKRVSSVLILEETK
jgi:lipopolysaccharide transport protein LptA